MGDSVGAGLSLVVIGIEPDQHFLFCCHAWVIKGTELHFHGLSRFDYSNGSFVAHRVEPVKEVSICGGHRIPSPWDESKMLRIARSMKDVKHPDTLLNRAI